MPFWGGNILRDVIWKCSERMFQAIEITKSKALEAETTVAS